MKIKKLINLFLVIIIILFLLLTLKMVHIYNICKDERAKAANISWSLTQRPFYSTDDNIDFMVFNKDINLRLWAESLTGKIDINITDQDDKVVFENGFNNIDDNISLKLEPGKYRFNIDVSKYTGGLYFGFKNATPVIELPQENFNVISGNINKSFIWDYILYTPDNITNKNLLVVPNNSGLVAKDIEIHKQKAIQLVTSKAQMADKLGVALLVPIFPRATGDEIMYTHALDRNTVLAPKNERLDLQLVSMIKDCQELLKSKGINLEDQVLLSGFSASGNFTDRFSFLHPELVKAVSFGGCDNMIPYSSLKGENLPYPIGIYDYKEIRGRDFDNQEFRKIKRFIYKGSKDEGGWVTTEDNEKTTTYTGLEYYEQVIAPEIESISTKSQVPVYLSGELNKAEENLIIYRVYDKKILLDKFRLVNGLFNNKGLSNNKFKIYEGIEHEITKDMNKEELEFFKDVLSTK